LWLGLEEEGGSAFSAAALRGAGPSAPPLDDRIRRMEAGLGELKSALGEKDSL